MPALRLRVRWLEQLGFAIGCKLRITVRDRELVHFAG
ncbi:SymE family type I addiction module toxin [Xanthomonas sp. GPE 39]